MTISTLAGAHAALAAYAKWWVDADPATRPTAPRFRPTPPRELDPAEVGRDDEAPADWVLGSLRTWPDPGAIVYAYPTPTATVPASVAGFRVWDAAGRRRRVGQWLVERPGPYGVRTTDPLQTLVDYTADLDRLTALVERCASCADSARDGGSPAAANALQRESAALDGFRADFESRYLPTAGRMFETWWSAAAAVTREAPQRLTRLTARAVTLRNA